MKMDRRSITGYVITYNGNPISWCSSKQKTITLSSSEAELQAMTQCLKEVKHLEELHDFLTDAKDNPESSKREKISIFTDNNQVLTGIRDGVTSKTKHYDIKWKYLQEQCKQFVMKRIPTDDNIADLLTKPLGGVRTRKLQSLMHMTC